MPPNSLKILLLFFSGNISQIISRVKQSEAFFFKHVITVLVFIAFDFKNIKWRVCTKSHESKW